MRGAELGLLALLAFGGCGSEESPDEPFVFDGVLELSDATNFRYEAELDVGTAAVAQGQDVFIDWRQLRTDMLGAPLDPAGDITDVFLVAFGSLEPEEVAQAIAGSDIPQDKVSVYLRCETEETGCWLSDFSLGGQSLDLERYFTEDSGTWMIVLSTLVPGETVRYRSLLFLEPLDDGPDEVIAAFEEGATRLRVDADLAGRAAARLPVGEDAVVDWSGLESDGLGTPVALQKLDRAELGWVPGLDIAAVEEDFLELESLPERRWTVDVSERNSLRLSELLDEQGEANTGVDTEGTWLFVLRCSTCASPMPLYVGRLEGVAGG